MAEKPSPVFPEMTLLSNKMMYLRKRCVRQCLCSALFICVLIAFMIWYLNLLIAGSLYQIDLSELTWRFKAENGSFEGTAKIPGEIYSDLYNNNLVPEPLFGENDRNLMWVSQTNWIYETIFVLDAEWKMQKAVLLNVHGLDTFATVFLNGEIVLVSHNQFISHIVRLKNCQIGTNLLVIHFESPVKKAAVLHKKFETANDHVMPPQCPPDVFRGECHVNMIRKIQASFGWDWGPSFPTVGIWKPLFIKGLNTFHIDRLSAYVKKIDDQFHVSMELLVYSVINTRSVNVQFVFPELSVQNVVTAEVKADIVNHIGTLIILPVKSVKLWWPNGQGEQPLYELTARISYNGEILEADFIKIGFRWIELVENYVDEKDKTKGNDFYFKINDVPTFLKGSNLIPISSFPAFNQSKRTKFTLQSMKEANMNALRVWGGGAYETDEFYKFTDEMGILIWQDMMFACAAYPSEDEFIESVRVEVTQQIYRLRHHPSILLWAGNNENAMGLADSWFRRYHYHEAEQKNDYMKLYNDLMKPLIEKLDDSKPYLHSSPSAGLKDLSAKNLLENPNGESRGDIHFYNEFLNLWKDSSYRTPRCATEYGVQSIPSKKTMLRWIKPENWFYSSKSMVERQHHAGGVDALISMILSHFTLPKVCDVANDKVECLNNGKLMDRIAYLTQMNQAIAVQVQSEHYLRYRGRYNSKGLGNTMCALIWQLNDVWAAPTWSSIDYNLNWKPIHYFAKRFFDEIILSMYINEESRLNLFVVSHKPEAVQNAQIDIQVFSFKSGLKPVYTHRKVATIQPQQSTEIDLEHKKYFKENIKHEELIIRARLRLNKGAQIGYDAILLPDKIEDWNLGSVKIEKFTVIDDITYQIDLSTDGIAPLVWLEYSNEVLGRFSDNGFTMLDQTVTVLLKLDSLDGGERLTRADVTVCSLKDCGLNF